MFHKLKGLVGFEVVCHLEEVLVWEGEELVYGLLGDEEPFTGVVEVLEVGVEGLFSGVHFWCLYDSEEGEGVWGGTGECGESEFDVVGATDFGELIALDEIDVALSFAGPVGGFGFVVECGVKTVIILWVGVIFKPLVTDFGLECVERVSGDYHSRKVTKRS